ncbi:MAG: serine/threonine protein kinase [Pseudomonadales bacterium]|nr:serine/threonine protein kinase [Pseudomonadales bacterium]
MSSTRTEQDLPFSNLTPDTLLDAVEQSGWIPDGTLVALNSYENRVYQVGIQEEEPVIVKFYRPGRWSDEQIQEEHNFLAELSDLELPCVAPLQSATGETLFHENNFRLTLFPRQGGYPPDIENPDNLQILARCIARIHAVGATQAFKHRKHLTVTGMGNESSGFLLEHDFIPQELIPAYETTSKDLLDRLADLSIPTNTRIHGDCHLGNILWRNDAPHFVDFDDALMGPAIQDLWLLLSGNRSERTGQLSELLEAYSEFHDFDLKQLNLIEPLRTLRIIHHAAWLARRWHDPAFPMAFPWFNTTRFWSDHILELREQMAALDEEPLRVY